MQRNSSVVKTYRYMINNVNTSPEPLPYQRIFAHLSLVKNTKIECKKIAVVMWRNYCRSTEPSTTIKRNTNGGMSLHVRWTPTTDTSNMTEVSGTSIAIKQPA